MDSLIQIQSFVFSFVYGYLFYILTRFNHYILLNKNTIFKLFINIVFVIDIVILYIYEMFKINKGIIHIYFVIVLIIGFIVGNITYDNVKAICQVCVKKIKKLK